MVQGQERGKVCNALAGDQRKCIEHAEARQANEGAADERHGKQGAWLIVWWSGMTPSLRSPRACNNGSVE